MKLLEEMDNIIDLSKKNLFQFDVEMPLIPSSLINDFLKLTQISASAAESVIPVSYTHLRAHETVLDLVCRLLLEKKKKIKKKKKE